MIIGGYRGLNGEPTKLSDIKSERQKVDGSRKMIQKSYKSFEKNIENSSTESINQKISLLEDTVRRHIEELLEILQKRYEFIVTTSNKDSSKIVVQLVDFNSKEIKKEIPAEDFLKMVNYIENIFYVEN